MEYFSNNTPPKNITILWDYDNVTRGAARLFGFLPKETTSEIITDKEMVVHLLCFQIGYLTFLLTLLI